MPVKRSPYPWIVLGIIAAGVYWLWPDSDPTNGAFSTDPTSDPFAVTTPDAGGVVTPAAVSLAANAVNPVGNRGANAAADAANAAFNVDETALRYFARQGDTRRYNAEVARLQALYPGWTPPADPLAAPVLTDTELDQMWALYAQGSYAEVRAAIADRQARQPGWEPPDSLLELLKVGESRDQLIAASDNAQYESVVRIAAQTPELLVCTELDVMWRVAEAFARTDRADRALAAYGYLLQNCDDPAARLATMQKALDNLGEDAFDTLWTYERTANGTPEFDQIRGEVARRRLATASDDATFNLAPEDRRRMEEAARADDGPEDATLLGWYHYLRDDFGDAEEWFRLAYERGETAEDSQGLALALIALDQASEAEDVIYPWREESDQIFSVYLAAVDTLLAMEPQPQLAPGVLARIVEVVGDSRDATSARQIGWYAYGFDQVTTAAQWFQASLNWEPVDNEDAAYGLALTRQRLGDSAGLAQLIATWGPRSLRIRALGGGAAAAEYQAALAAGLDVSALAVTPAPQAVVTPVAVQQVVTTPVSTAAVSTPAAAAPAASSTNTTSCTRTVDPTTLSPGAALSRGWCLMDLERPVEAAAAFEVAIHGTGATAHADAAYGLALAYLAAGLTDRAAIAATQAPQNDTRIKELQAGILAQRATSAFADGRYEEALGLLEERARIVDGEQNDLLMVRGYSYLYLGDYMHARQVFQAVAATGYPDARDGLAETERLQSILPGG